MKVILDIYNERMDFELVSAPFEWPFPKFPEKNDLINPEEFLEIVEFLKFGREDVSCDYHYFRNTEFNLKNGELCMTFQFYDEPAN